MAHYCTVIWDWNGTLADDAYASLLVVNDILAKRDMPPITMEQYYQYIDTPISRFYEHLFDLNVVTMDEITREFQEFYPRHFHSLHQGVPELLEALRQRNVRQVILSSGYQETLERDLRKFHIEGYFDAVLGSSDTLATGKVQRGLDWMAQQRISPQGMVMIGDTLHDYDTAKAMGVPCILCAIGHQSKEDLLTAGVPVVERFSQLESLLLPQNTAKN